MEKNIQLSYLQPPRHSSDIPAVNQRLQTFPPNLDPKNDFNPDLEYAVKVFDKRKINDKNKRKIVQTEIDIISVMRNKHVIRFHSMKEDENRVYVITESAGDTNLEDWLESVHTGGRAGGVRVLLTIFRQVVVGVNYLHGMNIVHRDIKARNILIDSKSGHCTLIDFGLSCF
jgi:serine/threonine protein kinase